MSKAQRACDGCRTRKSACQIDEAPPCRLCRAHRQACEFTPRVRRRKLPFAGVVSPSIDNSCAFPDMVQSSPVVDELHDQPSNVESLLADLNNDPEGLGTVFRNKPEFEVNHPSPQADDTMFDDLVQSMYDTQAPVLPRSLDNLPDVTAELCGLTGDMDPYVLQHYNYDINSEFAFSKLTIRQVQQSAVPVQFLLSTQELITETQTEAELADINTIVPPEIGERLIRLYFRFIQPQFPILSEVTPPTPMATPRHLLAAIYSIAQPFATFDDHLCIELVYKPPSAETLLNIAWHSLNQMLSQPTMSSIQTALILILKLPTNPLILDSARKWTLLGMLVSMAQTLGLHLDPGSWNLPDSEATLRRRLSWLVYAFDKWFAFSFGRPSHISRDDWLVTEISEHEMVSATGNILRFPLEFSRLTSILDETLYKLYSVRASATLSRDFRLTFETARPLLDALAQWAHAPSMSSDALTGYEGLAPLHIAYHAVKILILRALLRPFNHTDCQVMPEHQAEWEAAKIHIRQAARVEISAAIARVSSLEAVDYQAFWAPWYKTCFALITHLIFLLAVSSSKDVVSVGTADAEEEYAEFRRLLDHARGVLF
ncbi:fungal-specific transcription factor domain-containing protein [Aspergillus cavernicola]|uniref:Fungal-specific transcription factor domain-containing protein n=1 Tax=Aspergillus cavernicola TaxID=176166 RepID=A0ABR4HVV2_9EURO